MRIAFLIDSLNVHGSVRRLVSYANGLTHRGHIVIVATPDAAPCEWLPLDAAVIDLPQLAGEQVDALLVFGLSTYEMAEAADKCEARHRILFVLGLDGRILETLRRQFTGEAWAVGPIAKAIREAVKNPDAWTLAANSTWQYEWLRDNVREDTRLLLGGVDFSIFHPVKVWRVEKTWPTIISSGRIRRREGSIEVARACEILRGTYPDLKLATYDKAGIRQPDMARTYCMAHIAMDGQHYAGWNNFVVEAMACGVPVVCTDIGGVEDFAEDGVTALVVPPENAEALVEAATRLLSDEGLRGRLAKAALARVQWFTWEKALNDLEELLEEVISC